MVAPRMQIRFRRAAMLALATVLALSCGGGKSPATPTPSIAPPDLPPSGPTPPVAAACPFGKGSVETECSKRKPMELLSYVESAIDSIPQQKPNILDVTQEEPRGSRQYRILDVKAYIEAVLANLRAAGLCAEADHDFSLDTIHVKGSNDFSEEFTIVRWGEWVQRGSSSYREGCTPAAFPVDPDPNGPPAGSGCGKPYPAPIARFASKVHLKGPDFYTLDSTPLVGPDANYCMWIGYTDGRGFCPLRTEGSRDREACEAWRVGKAKDTGRDGPTWQYVSADGTTEYCKGLSVNGCENHPANQYLLNVSKGGTYRMCAQNGGCGEVVVDR